MSHKSIFRVLIVLFFIILSQISTPIYTRDIVRVDGEIIPPEDIINIGQLNLYAYNVASDTADADQRKATEYWGQDFIGDDMINDYFDRLSCFISKRVGSRYNLKIKIVNNDDFVRAESFIDGTCFIFKPFFKYIRNESMLIQILNHELGHVVARHLEESKTRKIIYGSDIITYNQNEAAEAEADILSIKFTLMCDRDPRQSIKMFHELSDSFINSYSGIRQRPELKIRADVFSKSIPQPATQKTFYENYEFKIIRSKILGLKGSSRESYLD